MGSVRRARELSDIAPQYIAKSGLCSTSELETTRWGSIKIQHVTGLTNVAEEKSRFPKLDECAHFHYEHVEIGPLEVSIIDNDNRKISSNESEEKWWSLCVQSQNKTWLIRRSYDNFRMLDQQLHRCIYDRKFSELTELPAECIENQENIHKLLSDYMKRFSIIAGSLINCGPILNWLELDNRGHRLLVPDTDNCPINTPAVAAAYSVKRYTAHAPDEISFEVGDMISVIDMPPPEESIWWHGKRGFQVGFFPCECVAVIGDKVPRNLKFSPQMPQPTKPVLRKHGKLIAFFRSFILSRPSRRRLKESGILKERVFGCDLGEHLLNSGHEIPMVLKCCVEFIETHGLVDGIYRLSGITSNIQKLRNAFDEDRIPALYEDEAILQDVHSVASLLKMYFRELPNPLCTYQLYHQFVAAVQSTQKDDPKLLKMRDVVQKLPPPHYRTLEYLMRHLARVSEKGHETGMTSRNVAIVWAPNLLRCKELEVGGVAALQGVGVQAVVTEFLVCYADLIFCDRLPNFSLPTQQVSTKKCRPKSLAISTPTKLLSLEEARTRALSQASGKAEPQYIEVGGGPSNLPAKYHTVIELPGYSRKRMGSKRSPLGWKLLFGKSGRSSQSRKETECKPGSCEIGVMTGKAVTESDLAQSRRHLRPSKSADSLSSSRNSEMVEVEPPTKEEGVVEDSLSPIMLRSCEGKNNGHNRSVSHESYFGQLQDQKVNLTLDISEIQVNFDLEESEMRIFSEDETLMSTGSGSLASNSSPRVFPSQKSGKGNNIKRLSYPKLSSAEDRYDTSQSTDPSPKKQKTNNENTAKSKLEERLSDSVGEIQFIDSVSPDQGLAHSEGHPIQSPSPVSSISQSSLLHKSSSILPHIPQLTEQLSINLESKKNLEHLGTDHLFSSDVYNLNSSTNSFAASSSVTSTSIVKINGSYLTNSNLVESAVLEKESFSVMSSELTTPETPICSTYTPLVDFDDSSLSNMTTPDFDMNVKIEKSASDNFDACIDFDNCESVEDTVAKTETKITMDVQSHYESITPDMVKAEPLKQGTGHPKPVERKAKIVHPYVNIPIIIPEIQDEKVTKTDCILDFQEKESTASNRNSVASIKYECISTESSCDSLINVNKDDEGATPLDFQSNESPLSENENSCIPIEITKKTLEASPSGRAEAEHNQQHETAYLSDYSQVSGKEFTLEKNLSKSDEEIDSFWNSICSDRAAPEELKVFSQNESLVNVNIEGNYGNEEFIENKLLNKSKVNCYGVVQLVEGAESLSDSVRTLVTFENESLSESTQEVNQQKSVIIEDEFTGEKSPCNEGPLIDDFVKAQNLLLSQRSEGVLETDLDAPEGAIGCTVFESMGKVKQTEENHGFEKENVPQKFNSRGNVRQLLSKFEHSPSSEKHISERRSDFGKAIMEKGELQSNVSNKNYVSTFKDKSYEERPKTLERLSTRRKMERDSVETTKLQLGKSKSGSQINDKKAEGDKADILLNCDFDLSDPQRRERIEKYKEKRRNYLREKYRSDSFKNDKDDVSFKFKQKHSRKNEWGEPNDSRNSFKSQKPQCGQSLEFLKEKRSPEKKDRFAGSRLWKETELPTNESDQRAFSVEYSDRSRSRNESITSSLRDHCDGKNNIFIFSRDNKSACDFKSVKSSPDKKNHFLNFSLGGSSEEEIQSADSSPRKSPRRKKEASRSSSLPNPREQEFGGRVFVKQKSVNSSGDSETPFLCIKDMTALFEGRNDSKAAKQYLSSV